MEADRAQGKSNPAFDGGEVEMQDLTPTGSDKGENEEQIDVEENGHISIPPMIQSKFIFREKSYRCDHAFSHLFF